MDNFDLKKYLTEGRLFEAQKGEPLNDKGLLNFLQQNMGEVLNQIEEEPTDTADLKFEFDGDGDPSITIGYATYSFRRPEHIDHIGPIGMEHIKDIESGFLTPFESEDGNDPMPIKVAGKDLIYVKYITQ
jgi:hypothetical protein